MHFGNREVKILRKSKGIRKFFVKSESGLANLLKLKIQNIPPPVYVPDSSLNIGKDRVFINMFILQVWDLFFAQNLCPPPQYIWSWLLPKYWKRKGVYKYVYIAGLRLCFSRKICGPLKMLNTLSNTPLNIFWKVYRPAKEIQDIYTIFDFFSTFSGFTEILRLKILKI